MAASSGSLNARLTLTGSDDVKRQLEDVGNAGAKSLGKINEGAHGEGLAGLEHSAENIAQTFEGLANFGSLAGIASIFRSITASVGEFGVVLGAGVTVIGAATAGLFELAEKGAKFASAIKDGATRVGTSAQSYAALRFAFEQSASSAEDFEKAMGVILEASTTADPAAENVQKAADKVVRNEERMKAAAQATADAWRTRADSLKEISIRSADDLSEITLKYTRAREAARKEDGAKEEADVKKAEDDRLEAIRLLNKRIKEEQRLANKAYQQELEKQSRENMRQHDEDLKAYYKAQEEAAAKAQGAVKKFSDLGVALKDGADKARDPAEIFRDIADKIGEIEDPATKSAKAVELFGRRIGTKLVEALSEGRGALKKLEDEAKHLNIIPDPEELKIGKKFDDEIAKLGSVVAAASGRVGLAFAPLFGEVVDALASTIGHAIPGMIAAAQVVATALKPIFDDVTQAVLGNTSEIKSQFIYALVRAVEIFVEVMKGAGTIIGGVLKAIAVAFNYVDGIIQSVFGGASIGGIAGFLLSMRLILGVVTLLWSGLVALVGGPLALLATALGPIVTAIGAVAAAVGWPVILAAGIIALIATLLLADDGWANFKKGVVAVAEVVASFIKWLTDPLVNAFNTATEAGKHAWDVIVYWAQYAAGLIGQAWDWIFDKIKTVADAIASVLGTSSSVASQTTVPFHPVDVTSHAEGGLISGPGSATSDSILSRLSDGEYVVKTRAVKFWGLRVLNALNNMVSPKGYAAGGYIDALGGGAATASRSGGLGLYQAAAALEGRVSVDLTHNGTTFHGLLAPAEIAARMVRYASSQQRVSLGRRSSAWGAATG